MAYVVLYGFDQIPIPSLDSYEDCSSLNSTNIPNATNCLTMETVYKFCGMNDCQDADVVSQSINHYQPVNKLSLYVLIGICFALAVGAALVHGVLIPNDKTIVRKQKYYKSQMEMLQRDNDDQPDKPTDDKVAQTHQALYAPSKVWYFSMVMEFDSLWFSEIAPDSQFGGQKYVNYPVESEHCRCLFICVVP